MGWTRRVTRASFPRRLESGQLPAGEASRSPRHRPEVMSTRADARTRQQVAEEEAPSLRRDRVLARRRVRT